MNTSTYRVPRNACWTTDPPFGLREAAALGTYVHRLEALLSDDQYTYQLTFARQKASVRLTVAMELHDPPVLAKNVTDLAEYLKATETFAQAASSLIYYEMPDVLSQITATISETFLGLGAEEAERLRFLVPYQPHGPWEYISPRTYYDTRAQARWTIEHPLVCTAPLPDLAVPAVLELVQDEVIEDVHLTLAYPRKKCASQKNPWEYISHGTPN